MGNMGTYGKLIGKQWENNGKYEDISQVVDIRETVRK